MKKEQARPRKPLWPLLLAFLACGGVKVYPQSPERKTFTSATAGYMVEYPGTWHQLLHSLPTLYIVNFPPSQRAHAVVLPPGGASIAIVPPPLGTLNAEEWAERDLKPGMALVSKSHLQLRGLDSDSLIEATEVELARRAPGAEFSNVDCYFTFAGHPFAGRLTYRKGDSKAPEYLETLHHVIESLRIPNGTVVGRGGQRMP